jgi:hypothetical protein
MGIPCNHNLCLFGEFCSDIPRVPVKGCNVVMDLFFSFNMGGKISIGSRFPASIEFARFGLAFQFTGKSNGFSLSLAGSDAAAGEISPAPCGYCLSAGRQGL